MKLGSHIPALDGLRGVAILLVLVYHATVDSNGGGVLPDRFVGFWTSAGWSGVDLFFVLSGFLITGILYDSKGTVNYFKTFYARRFLRIFPAYYATLFVLLVVLPSIPYIQRNFEKLAGDEIWYWLYLSNLSLGLQYALEPRRLDYLWSLAIEEQFYLIWPLVVLLFSRRRLMQICVGLVGLAIVWRTGLLLAGAHSLTVYALTPSRIDSLAVGAFIALAVRGEFGISSLLRWARPVAILSGLALVGMAMWDGHVDPYEEKMQIIGYTLLALFYAGTLVLALGSSPHAITVRVLEHRLLRMFGRYSYALYLFHVPLIIIIQEKVFRSDQISSLQGSMLAGKFLFTTIAICVSLLLAWLSWHLYEKRFLELKRYFSYRRRTNVGNRSAPEVPAEVA